MGVQEVVSTQRKKPCPHGRIEWCEKCYAIVSPTMSSENMFNPQPNAKFISNIEIDPEKAWENFRDSALRGLDDDFTLKVCRISFVAGMTNLSNVHTHFALCMSDFMRMIIKQGITNHTGDSSVDEETTEESNYENN